MLGFIRDITYSKLMAKRKQIDSNCSKNAEQAKLIKCLRRKLPKIGKTISDSKRSYSRKVSKKEAKKELEIDS